MIKYNCPPSDDRYTDSYPDDFGSLDNLQQEVIKSGYTYEVGTCKSGTRVRLFEIEPTFKVVAKADGASINEALRKAMNLVKR